MKTKLVRFGVSIEEGLISKFNRLIRERRYGSRSEAIRDLIRAALVEKEWEKGGNIAGGIGFVYDHHLRRLTERLTDTQHDFRDLIVSSTHIHLDHDNCLELVTVKGDAKRIKKLFDLIKAAKGVKHAGLIRTTTGRDIG